MWKGLHNPLWRKGGNPQSLGMCICEICLLGIGQMNLPNTNIV
jgi:hypothetical protein